MANKTLRLSVGSIFSKGPGKIYFYRYQLKGRRKTVSLQTSNRSEALRKAQELLPIVRASTPEIVAAQVEYANGFREAEPTGCLRCCWMPKLGKATIISARSYVRYRRCFSGGRAEFYARV